MQETAKLLQSYCKENCKAFKCYSINILLCFLFLFLQFCSDRDMYRKNEGLACKNRANGGGLAGLVGWFFAENCKTAKNFIKCLIFNGLMLCSFLCSGFAVALQWLFSAEKSLTFNDLPNITQMLDFQRFCSAGWVKGRVLSKG